MRTILFGLLVAAFAATCTAEDTPALEKTFTVKLSRLLPYRWFVEDVTVNAVPYNHGIKEGRRRGTSMKLVGPSIVNKGPKGLGGMNHDEPESLYIWIMPADYTPTPIPLSVQGQFAAARLLGSNETIAVYGMSVFGTPSWATWENDVVYRLGLKGVNYGPPRPRLEPIRVDRTQ